MIFARSEARARLRLPRYANGERVVKAYMEASLGRKVHLIPSRPEESVTEHRASAKWKSRTQRRNAGKLRL